MSISSHSSSSPHVFWLTGLSGAGKSRLAVALANALQASGCSVTVLDGDELRRGLCADLGYDENSKHENVRRAGEVAKLLHSAGVTVIVALISPYAADRTGARALFTSGQFSEIHVATPFIECRRRDPKGLYAKAEAGQIRGLTGFLMLLMRSHCIQSLLWIPRRCLSNKYSHLFWLWVVFESLK